MKSLRTFAKPASWSSLALIVAPPILYFTDAINSGTMNHLMIAGTLIWFASAPWWMKGE